MTAQQAQSEKVSFSVDLLFSEPLHFELNESIAAVNEDFPACQIKDSGMNPTTSIKTDNAVLGILAPVEAHDGGFILMSGAGFPDEGFRSADHSEALWRSAGFGQAEVTSHQSYINISVDAVDDTLAARFRAARLLNVVTAVFAKLPITLAVFVHWSGHFARPDHWVAAAEQAAKGEWPLQSWLSYRADWQDMSGQSQKYAVGYTNGLVKFLPYELHMEAAPIEPTDVIQMLTGAVWTPLQGGSVYADGDTVGVEEGLRYTIRRRPTLHEEAPEIYVLLHPESPVDEKAVFGPRPGIQTPMEEPYIRRPKKGFMRSLLGRN